MTFEQRMLNRALVLLKKYGRPMILKRTFAGAYVPATGQTGADTVTEHNCYGFKQFITRTSANQFYGTSTLKETLIQKDDEMCFIAAKDLAIVPTFPLDRILIGGHEYSIMFTTPLSSGESDVLYVVQIRK